MCILAKEEEKDLQNKHPGNEENFMMVSRPFSPSQKMCLACDGWSSHFISQA
jgi:hypothetical protein